MKIAIIGSQIFDSMEYNLNESLIFLGHQSKIFDIYTSFIYRGSIGKYAKVYNKIRRNYDNNFDVEVFQKLFNRVSDYNPDLVICVYRFIHPQFVSNCKYKGYTIIHINPDALTTFEYQQVFASNYDVWFSKDPYIVRFMHENMHLNAKLYNEAFNKRIHVKPKENKKDFENNYNIDVMTYGTLYPYRCRMLNILAERGINMKIYGIKPHRFYNHSLDKYFSGRYITGKEKSDILYGSKIVFNQMHFAEIESMNNRFFEVNGSGAFQLSDYRPILHELLPIDPELVSFHNINEAVDKIQYYLKYPEKRYDIASIIYNHFIKKYSYENLLNYILNNI